MEIANRRGTWVLRIYSKNQDGTWLVGIEQYFPTRSMMRKHVKVWKLVTRGCRFKIKTYRILGVSGPSDQYNVVWYKDAR